MASHHLSMEKRTFAHDDPEVCGLEPPRGGKWYACHLSHKYLEFRQPELESVAATKGCNVQDVLWRLPPSTDPMMMPIWYVSLPSDDIARQVVSRTMLTKGLYELWGEGSTWEELEASIQAYPEHLKLPWCRKDLSFKVHVDSYGRRIDIKEQVEYVERLGFIPFQGKVDLKQPQVKFWLMVIDVHESHGLGDTSMVPYRLYFGRQIAEYGHQVVAQYSLKTRPYIGPTSMDTEMAFIMCNQAKVDRGSFVFDPYVGTGSITVAAAHHGAQVMGTDIDMRVVKLGKKGPQGQTLDVYVNFDHYGIRNCLAGLIRGDMHRHPFRDGLKEVFHAIVGDPPYGVRAGGRKSAYRDIQIRDPSTHIPGTAPYSLGECLRDLLDFAARMLAIGGRLVLFIPATPETYIEEEIPRHPTLKLIYNSEQILTTRYSRRLITYEKLHAYDAAAAARHHEANPDPTMAIDRIHDIVYDSYERDENGQVIYPEGALNAKKFRGKKI
uniref:tRNA (guanine(10)-N(2))-methyltransferase n=1 Tax=Dunaliella tertiolecta TaxID=3047 RepID=A0A7S3VQJ9_DUNTE|mmetsp:Transcript_20550/g.57288  ORF Transcript_20550/g.57288 Transcript_20550/m.57288 type:complete len:495 (-) Transcript_20550:319-1803(-)